MRVLTAFLFIAGSFGGLACSRPSHEETAAAREPAAADSLEANPASSKETLGERDYRSAAQKVVSQSARVKEGDVVLINGSDEDLPLLEDLAIEVRKRGASPIVTVFSTGFNRRTYDEVPAKYDTLPPRSTLELLKVIDVFISTEAGEQRTLKDVPAERIAARSKAFGPITALSRKRNVRSVFLGNGLYPSAESADQYDVSRDELARMLYDGVDIDFAQLQQTGANVQRLLTAAKEVRITAPNGTDLRMRIAGRPAYVSDGIISPEDLRRGGPAATVWLPAGEVYLVPVPGTAEGILVADHDFYRGEPIEGMRLEFKGGKLTAMTAKSGLEPLKALYNASGRGRDELSALDLGINPGLKLPAGKPIYPWSRAGMVTVGVGSNTWAGGTNEASFSVAPHLPDATLAVDGKVLVDGGKLVAGEQVAAQ
jgi:leucyl aminopeptidase (aminopeptidase T)